MKWTERVMSVTVVLLCATTILHLAGGEWFYCITCSLWVFIAWMYWKRESTIETLLHAVQVYKASSEYDQRHAEACEKIIKSQEDFINHIKENLPADGKMLEYLGQVIENTKRVANVNEQLLGMLNEHHTFMPSEGE